MMVEIKKQPDGILTSRGVMTKTGRKLGNVLSVSPGIEKSFQL
jgi:hypothetical protein